MPSWRENLIPLYNLQLAGLLALTQGSRIMSRAMEGRGGSHRPVNTKFADYLKQTPAPGWDLHFHQEHQDYTGALQTPSKHASVLGSRMSTKVTSWNSLYPAWAQAPHNPWHSLLSDCWRLEERYLSGGVAFSSFYTPKALVTMSHTEKVSFLT